MASSNRCIEILLGHKDAVFSPQDFTLCSQKMFDSDLQYALVLGEEGEHSRHRAMKTRDVMTTPEKAAVEAFVKPHQHGRTSKVLHNTINYLVNLRNPKVCHVVAPVLAHCGRPRSSSHVSSWPT